MNKESREELFNKLVTITEQQLEDRLSAEEVDTVDDPSFTRLKTFIDIREEMYKIDPVGATISEMKSYLNSCGFSFCHLHKCLTNKYIDHYTAKEDSDGNLILNIYIAEGYEIKSEPTETWRSIIINLYGGNEDECK